MNNFQKNLLRAVAFTLVIATLAISVCSCGKNISEVEVITTEHYSVSAGMVTYSLYDSYYYYVNMFGAQGMLLYFGIDTAVSLKNQYADTATKKTWFDVFKTDAIDGFCNSLAMCEAAIADGVELSDIDQKFIQSEIDEIAEMGAKQNMSIDEYIEYIYTEGVTVADVRKSLEIYRLANKKRYKDFNEAKVTDGEINDDLKANGDKYLQRELIYFECVLSNESEKNPTIKEYAKRLSEATTEADFRAIVAEFLASDVCADTKKEVVSITQKNNADDENKGDFDKWLFASDTEIGDTFLSESTVSHTVYMVLTDPAMDISGTKNIYTMLFSADVYGSDDGAKAKAEEIYAQWKAEGETIEKFKELAAKYTTDYASTYSGGQYFNVMKGDLITELDTWLFDDARAEGDHAIVKTAYGYHIVVYVGAGEPAWKVPIIETIKDDKTTSKMQSYMELYTVTIIQGNLKYVQGR